MAPGIGDYTVGMPGKSAMASAKAAMTPSEKIKQLEQYIMDMEGGDQVSKVISTLCFFKYPC